MDALVPFNNAIRFVCEDEEGGDDGPSLWLLMDGEMTLTAGVKPNVHAFTCFYREYAAIQGSPGRTGRLEFFHSASWDPADGPHDVEPDLILERMRIVDVEVAEVGVTSEQPANAPAGVVAVRLFIADRRADFVYPRGGVLDRGELNKQPYSEDGLKDANGNPVLNAWFLAHMCIYAMGLDPVDEDAEVSVPLAIGDGVPPVDVEWRGNHAPTELEEILDANDYAFTVDAAGAFAIVQKNSGPQPAFPADAVRTPNLGIDRRGAVVVFGSHPYPVTNTVTLSGPGDYKSPAGTDVLEYVFINPKDGKVMPLDQASRDLWKGLDPARLVTSGYLPGFDPLYLKVAIENAFRCVRINPTNPEWGDTPLLASLTREKESASRRIQVEAIVPQKGEDGLWRNSPERVQVYATNLLNEGRVLVFGSRLMKVDPFYTKGVDHPTKYLVPLEDGDLRITATIEEARRDEEGRWVPEYFQVGYRSDLGRIAKLSASELELVLRDPKTPIVPRPELRLHRVDGVDQNRARLEDVAGNLAPAYVQGSGDPTALVVVNGFAGYTPNARISSVKISQDPPRTTVEANAWFFPHGGYLFRDKRSGPKARKEEGEKFPQQNHTAAARAAQGVAGAAAPSAVIYPFQPSEEVAATTGVVKIVGVEAGGGKYKGKLLRGSAKATPAGDLPVKTVEGASADEGMQEGEDCLVLNADEAGQKTHALWLGPQFPVYAPGEIVGTTTPAADSEEKPRPIVLVRVVSPASPIVVALSKDGGVDGTTTMSATWTYTVRLNNYAGEVVLTQASPEVGRENGKRVQATAGLGYYNGEREFKLLYAFERPGTAAGGCA